MRNILHTIREDRKGPPYRLRPLIEDQCLPTRHKPSQQRGPDQLNLLAAGQTADGDQLGASERTVVGYIGWQDAIGQAPPTLAAH